MQALAVAPCQKSARPRSMRVSASHAAASSSHHPLDDQVILTRIKQQFNGRAANYDSESNGYHASLSQHLLSMCKLQPGQRVLDLAAGTGIAAVPAAESVAPGGGHVVAVDISKAMLEQARQKAAAAGVQASMDFIEGDMERLQDCLSQQLLGSFSTITCSAATPFLRDPPAALAAWRSWLAPGGTLAFNAFVAPALEDFALFREVAVEFGFSKPPDPCEALGSEQLVTKALQAAGYHNIQVVAEHKRRSWPAESTAEYAERVWQTSISNNPFVTLADEQQHEGQLEEFHQGYVAAVQDGLVKSGRFQAGQVTNCYTVLHVVAQQ